ncbi:hypothetical protein L873DRAFT_1823573 [Choiromyces venosus 120613-1]|uniref:Uncharacterized protein n=1 Tax=Choiromyces venosus 120613-1 TaxID=1336337 RepID=A0A3N4J5A6_9PEZI|nr:hypothetical protein L873DRAFT_1823573 [Choiromyces venosus 120613-1]
MIATLLRLFLYLYYDCSDDHGYISLLRPQLHPSFFSHYYVPLATGITSLLQP